MAKKTPTPTNTLSVRDTVINTPGALATKLQGLKPGQKVYTAEQLLSADKAQSKKKTASVGVTATRMWGDVFAEEYIGELKGPSGAIIYENMLRGDYQVGLLEESIMGIIKAAHFSFSIPDVKNGDKHAELCEWQWNHGFDKDPDENLNDLGSHIFFGHAEFEPMDYVAYKHPKYGLIWKLKNLGFRDQTSITEWKIVNSDLVAVHQQTNYTTPYVDVWIPGENLMVLSEKRKGNNFEGRALLRKAYGPYWRKNIFYKLLGIGLEKASLGLIIITVPPNKVGSSEETAFLEAVANYVTHENAYLKKTGKMSNDKFEGFDIEVVNIDFKADAVLNAIKLEDTNIAKCGAAAFSELGQGGNGGAYNLGVADIDFFFSMVLGRIRYICSKLSKRIWPDLIRYNYGEQAEYPVMKGELEGKAGEELARILNYFYNIGVYTPQPDDEAYLRKKYNLPELKIQASSDPAKEKVSPLMPPAAPGKGPVDEEDEEEDPPEEGTEESDAADDNVDDQEVEEEDSKPAPKAKDAEKAKLSKLSKRDAAYIKSVTKGIDLKGFKAEESLLTESWNKDIRVALASIQDKYLTDLENKLKHNPDNKIGAVANIELGFTSRLKEAITDGLTAAMKTGKAQGKKILSAKKKNLSLNSLANMDDFLPKNRAWLKSTCAVTYKIMLDALGKEGLLSAKKSVDQGLSDAEVMFNVRQDLDNWKANDNNLGAGAIIPAVLDVGRDETYYNSGASITAWIYVNDVPVTGICSWLDGRVAREGDPNVELYSPPNHWGCDGRKIPIMSDEEQPEEFDGWDVPASVLAQQETLNDAHNHKIPEMWRGITRRAA